MTIEEAIIILETAVNFVDPNKPTNVTRAEKLGIEALKVLDLARFNSNGEWPPPLPGETKE